MKRLVSSLKLFDGKPGGSIRQHCLQSMLRSLCMRALAGLIAWMPFFWVASTHGQWLTESFKLTNGWNAVHMHIDASHDTLQHLVGDDPNNPITEIWQWAPHPTTLQFLDDLQGVIGNEPDFLKWVRDSTEPQMFDRLQGNTTYLVRVGGSTSTYTWQVKGKPVPPATEWTISGLNFLGFSTVPTYPPNFDAFLVPAPELQHDAEIYQYVGGDLGQNNPRRIVAMRTTPVTRGQAYWIRATNVYNRYFGPFEVVLSSPSGIDFGEHLGTAAFRLRNLTANKLTIALELVPSEAPPAGQASIAGAPPLLIRGALNLTNLTYGYTNLPTGVKRKWTLEPNGTQASETEVVLGLDRAAMPGAVGDQFAGILRFADSLGFLQVNVGITAKVGSSAGLWVGNAAVTQVGNYLKTYERDSSGNPAMDTNGQYVVTGINTNIGPVASPYSLRLIVHNPESGNAVLLQRVYVGPDANTNIVVANQESALNKSMLSQARRVSAAHLPWSSANTGWTFNVLLNRVGRASGNEVRFPGQVFGERCFADNSGHGRCQPNT
ncbi:MAG: hypothetical protein QHJ82_00545 [Verrucomicrobiota bacterium]|nr:hypothetical protein [Verrucomicrobiota bacterium]